MTKDRVTLRLNLAAVYRVADARRLATVARAPDEVLYLAVQLASREAVATRTLDELLAAREELGQAIRPAVRSALPRWVSSCSTWASRTSCCRVR